MKSFGSSILKRTTSSYAIGAYIAACAFNQVYRGVNDVTVPVHWDYEGGNQDDNVPQIRKIVGDGLDFNGYICPRFHILNPFQYFAYRSFRKARQETALLYKQFSEYDDKGDHHKISFLKLKEHPDTKIPLYYVVSGFPSIMGGSYIVTSIKTVYGTPDDLTVGKYYDFCSAFLWGPDIDGRRQPYWLSSGYEGKLSFN